MKERIDATYYGLRIFEERIVCRTFYFEDLGLWGESLNELCDRGGSHKVTRPREKQNGKIEAGKCTGPIVFRQRAHNAVVCIEIQVAEISCDGLKY